MRALRRLMSGGGKGGGGGATPVLPAAPIAIADLPSMRAHVVSTRSYTASNSLVLSGRARAAGPAGGQPPPLRRFPAAPRAARAAAPAVLCSV